MSDLLLDENEVYSYEKLNKSGGLGKKAEFALSQYNSRLGNLSGQGFGPNDTSTAHAVIDELRTQMGKIEGTMAEIDSMIDDLVRILEVDVIERENALIKEV
ncbi:MAG: hypothetical protein K6F83_07645 [Clostridiales bacterium]|nr:hypothetical protein [Clostridiales bacterium]